MLEPERWAMAGPALAGAALYGLYSLGALIGAGHQPSGRDMVNAFFNVSCALVAGVLVAYFAGPELLRLAPFAKALGPSPAGVIIGAFAWEVLPLMFRLGKQAFARWMRSKTDAAEGGR